MCSFSLQKLNVHPLTSPIQHYTTELEWGLPFPTYDFQPINGLIHHEWTVVHFNSRPRDQLGHNNVFTCLNNHGLWVLVTTFSWVGFQKVPLLKVRTPKCNKSPFLSTWNHAKGPLRDILNSQNLKNFEVQYFKSLDDEWQTSLEFFTVSFHFWQWEMFLKRNCKTWYTVNILQIISTIFVLLHPVIIRILTVWNPNKVNHFNLSKLTGESIMTHVSTDSSTILQCWIHHCQMEVVLMSSNCSLTHLTQFDLHWSGSESLV